MTPRRTTVYLVVGLLFSVFVSAIGNAQETSVPVKAVQLTGRKGIKDNTKGTLSVENGNLHFVHDKENSDVSATSIQDVVTGADSRESVGKTVGIMGMAAPYGGGRVLSLFRTKIDTLTVEYRDPEGALHGAIFTMSAGTADASKKQLVAQGAHTTATGEPTAVPSPSSTSPNKEQKQ